MGAVRTLGDGVVGVADERISDLANAALLPLRLCPGKVGVDPALVRRTRCVCV